LRGEIERWLFAHIDDWISGRPGDETVRRLRSIPETRIPDDFLFYVASSLAASETGPLRSEALGGLATTMIEEPRARRVAIAVSEGFESAGVPHVFIKGADLRYRLYDDPCQRPGSDVDVLCDPAARKEAAIALQGLGAELQRNDGFFEGYGYELSAHLGGVGVDLHGSMLSSWRSRFDAASVIEDREAMEIDGGKLWVTRREDAVAIALIHTGRVLGGREYVAFKHGIDLALMLSRWEGIDWHRIAERVAVWRCLRLAGGGLWAWRPWLGGLIPREALHALDPGPLQRRVAQADPRILVRPEVRTSRVLRARRLAGQVLFSDGFSERAAILRGALAGFFQVSH